MMRTMRDTQSSSAPDAFPFRMTSDAFLEGKDLMVKGVLTIEGVKHQWNCEHSNDEGLKGWPGHI